MKNLVNVLLYLWQLPQNILGWILYIYFGGNRKEVSISDDISVYLIRSNRQKNGISLGKYIIVNQFFSKADIAHEMGHCRQSLYLGWFYLLVIGLPSIIWALWWNQCRGIDYSSFYTEKWADKLGKQLK